MINSIKTLKPSLTNTCIIYLPVFQLWIDDWPVFWWDLLSFCHWICSAHLKEVSRLLEFLALQRLRKRWEMICSRYKSMGVKIVLPSSSKSMSSSLSESDSMSCSTFVLEAGGLLSSLKSSLILFLEAGADFVLEGDTFGRSIISSRPRYR